MHLPLAAAPRLVLAALLLLPACGDAGGESSDSGDTGATNETSGAGGDTPADAGDATEGGGEAPPCGGPCPEGSVCIHASMDELDLSCGDATDVYDDGTEPAKAFEDAGDGWFRKRVSGWEALTLRCNDGSPYGYYISPGTGAGRDKWVIYHKGGGGCFDAESCGWRWLTQPQYMRQQRTVNKKYTPGDPATIDEGIYSREEPSNHFRDWTFVHLHYCSSDGWAGTALGPDNPSSLYMRGRPIAEAVVAELLAGVDVAPTDVDLPRLADATDVLITGGSAGATGARHNMDLLATRIREGHTTGELTIRGNADAAFSPPILPQHYTTREDTREFIGGTHDASCAAAHPDALHLCDDPVHLANGRGVAEYFGGVDDGHLGEAAPGESAVDSVFLFMSLLDGSARSNNRLWSLCARVECDSHGDCGPGQACTQGLCLTLEPCEMRYCTPDDAACYGADVPPACYGGVATHPSACDGAADCDAGERCVDGLCVEDLYLGCEAHEACLAGELCLDGRCTRAVTSAGQCDEPGYGYNSDSGACEQVLGCDDEVSLCGEGYACVPWTNTPSGQAFQGMIRGALLGLGPHVSTFAPLNGTHTASGSSKYFAQIYKANVGDYVEVASLRVGGQSYAEAMGEWYSGAVAYVEAVAPLGELPAPLVAAAIEDVSLSVSANTDASGCDSDAVLFIVCGIDSPCTSPADAAAVAAVGDQSTTSSLGAPLPGPSQLKLVIAANPACGGATVEVAAGDHVAVTLQYDDEPGHVVTRKVALPAVTTSTAPQTLYIGIDGATWADATFEQLAARRL